MRWVILLLPLLLLACSAATPESELTDLGRTVTPKGGNGIVLAGDADTAPVTDDLIPAPVLKVRLPPEYIPSQALTVDLDFDDTEEQIIVFKHRDDDLDLIRVLVVLYDPVRNSWIRAWEGATQATIVRSFSVYTDDLIGDHAQEIICFGINNAGEQTLDLFRRTPDILGLGVVYSPILSITADVSISVESMDRPEAYEELATSAVMSYPVVAERLDPESDNLLDAVKTTYTWDAVRRRYARRSTEYVPGEEIQDSRLSDLFAGDELEFERFLGGPWFRSSEGGQTRILFFGLPDRSVVFHGGQLQQSFLWSHTTKAVYGRGAQLYVTNESIRAFNTLVTVSVVDLNQINVSVAGSRSLNGTYERLTGTLQSAVLSRPEIAELSDIPLSGLYRDDSGIEIVFNAPEVSYLDQEGVHTGGFVLFDISGQTVLSLLFVDENRLPISQLDFGVTYSEVVEEERIVRTVALESGEVGLAGFRADGESSMVLEQIVVVEPPEAQ